MDSVTNALMQEFVESNLLSDLSIDKQFEHFTAYSIVSSHYADEFETVELVAGDGQDLNVDAFAVKINGRIANDADFVDDVLEMNGFLEVEFIIIQAKSSSSFDGSAIIALGDNLVNEVFSQSQKLKYNNDIKRLIDIKDRIYKNASKLKANPVCRVYYACTGNWADDPYLEAIFERKRQELVNTNLFSEVRFEPIGARQIQSLYRATKTSISREVIFDKLITLPKIRDVSASYLGILPVTEFLKLLTNENGDIVKSIFIDNVRDFQGENDVNKDIEKTIIDELYDQFVLRNNGITIVARNIRVTSSQYILEDYQIVNGCQTSHVIFNNKNKIHGELFVPIKLIHTTKEDVAQSIIKSTNKQTNIEENDLLALTQFQRDLEDYYSNQIEEIKLYYERRAKQYATNNNIEKGRIVTIGGQLKCFSSMFIDLPHQASRYQGTLLKTVQSRVFQSNHKPEPYFISALALYRFEIAIRKLNSDERDIRPFKYFLLLAFRVRYENVDFQGAANKNINNYCAQLLPYLMNTAEAKKVFDECVLIVREALQLLNLPVARDSAKSKPLVDKVKEVAASRRPQQVSGD
ncbi:AIPR family protein [Alcaligenes aquatilis]|uniref:AIPR family protein n=1 Tax=Alcaligenes aquatilis TaxID=323284 RepID=A0ABY4NM51_9BURK|nr:AIPR family protein [Alcaligenes aquatilis]UQN37671.1 AIPR family protein [Alcaligenes aquatilis]